MRGDGAGRRMPASMNPPLRPTGLAALCATFGNPGNFLEDKARWEALTLTRVPLVTPLRYAYPHPVTGAPQMVSTVWAHHLIARRLVDTLQACLDAGVPHDRLVYGGCYTWRAQRGGTKLSTHAWGIAVDLDPVHNPLGAEWKDDGVMLHPGIIHTWQQMGWFWGGAFHRRLDPQHMQWVTGY